MVVTKRRLGPLALIIPMLLIFAGFGVRAQQTEYDRPDYSKVPAGPVAPIDIRSAVSSLRSSLSDEQVAAKRAMSQEEFLRTHQFGLGSWIREEWLQPESNLSKFFEKEGVTDSESATEILLKALWMELRGQPASIDALLDEYHRFQSSLVAPEDRECPNHPGVELEMKHIGLTRDSNGERVVRHFAICPVDSSRWGYELKRGWFELTDDSPSSGDFDTPETPN